MKNKIFILLDRSASMNSMWEEALGGINAYVKKIENADVMLASFDTLGYDVIRNTTTSKWENITTKEIEPRGGTPLLDAAGRIMWTMLDSKAKRAILVVVTDGEENSSSKFTSADIKTLTKQLTEKCDYEIVFLGANFDKIDTVAKSNFGWQDNSRVTATSVRGFGIAMNATAEGTQHYFSSGKTTDFYSEELKSEAKK